MTRRQKSLLAGASDGLKVINQDCFAIETVLQGNLLMVADGLGSFEKSEEASRFCCQNMVKVMKELSLEDNPLDLGDAFLLVYQNLKEKYEDLAHQKSHGTTLICCLETKTEYKIGYVGNGGIFHIRGNFHSFPKQYYLPWNAINLLNPHSVPEEGKEALYKFYAPKNMEFTATPTMLTLTKDTVKFGDILMICTDGVFSNDQVKVGKDTNGKIWTGSEEHVSIFYGMLSAFVRNGKYSTASLTLMLKTYLGKLKEQGSMHDDTTIALTVSEKAIDHWQKKQIRDANQN